MFKVEKVKDCPHTRRSQGIVLMTPSLISQLAAAVHDKDEWAIILTGERRQQGYEIEVTGYHLPSQERSGGAVEIAEFDLEPEDVGVIHSHHHMGAFFSTTDDTKLNPRFPMSIVVAQGKNQYLGFEYKGTGKVTLPCGASGEIEFKIQPTAGPVVNEIKQVVHKKDDLGDCVRVTNNAADQFHVHNIAACGLSEEPALRANAFGIDKALLTQVEKIARPKPMIQYGGYTSQFDNFNSRNKTSAKNPNGGRKHNYLNSLIPDRFKSKPKEIEVDKSLDMLTLCEVCNTYDDFSDWDCGVCRKGEYCMRCDVGHDPAKGCPQYPLGLTGA